MPLYLFSRFSAKMAVSSCNSSSNLPPDAKYLAQNPPVRLDVSQVPVGIILTDGIHPCWHDVRSRRLRVAPDDLRCA